MYWQINNVLLVEAEHAFTTTIKYDTFLKTLVLILLFYCFLLGQVISLYFRYSFLGCLIIYIEALNNFINLTERYGD